MSAVTVSVPGAVRPIDTLRFHARNALFNFQEQFTNFWAGVAAQAVFPFFIWLLSKIWERFNAPQGNFKFHEILLYIGVTEVLFMTFLRTAMITQSSGDFSLSLARPRSWLAMCFSGIFGRVFGSRLIMILVFAIAVPVLGAGMRETGECILRLLILLPWLGVLQALVVLLLASAQIVWNQISYFFFPIGKIFLVLGGVFGPVIDFSQPWRDFLLALPPSDLFFQVGYFCIRGEFFGMSVTHWFIKTGVLALILFGCNLLFYRVARRHHQAYGG